MKNNIRCFFRKNLFQIDLNFDQRFLSLVEHLIVNCLCVVCKFNSAINRIQLNHQHWCCDDDAQFQRMTLKCLNGPGRTMQIVTFILNTNRVLLYQAMKSSLNSAMFVIFERYSVACAAV
ncbi:hypothetical protein T12_4709 [Trichinella patagoniensis]|uniref:Uncharacterized protein n=1 Tax=Trichinella patagoniensis TaxID=990121 RepID=A0A0V1A088_9BILA|nr:hypothetical protein T12_1853 [Trichinella patagoniensis]KRY18326.1 hypothetical protein T12_4709 [Trichinella patagoniensis]